MTRSLTKGLSAVQKIPYGVLIGLGAKETYTQTRIGTGTAAYNWVNEGDSMTENGIFAWCQAGVDDQCSGAYSARLAHRNYSWSIPADATITALQIRYKVYSLSASHLYRCRASWNDGTSWTTMQQGTFPTTLSWVTYDATQGHPNWTIAELGQLRSQICSVSGSPTYLDYCDVIQAVATYEL